MKGLVIWDSGTRDAAKVAITEPSLAGAAKSILKATHFPSDVSCAIVLATWPTVTSTKLSWTARHKGYHLTGERFLHLRRRDYLVYHRSELPNRVPTTPPSVAGQDWWSQAVRGLLNQIVNEINAWCASHEYGAPLHTEVQHSAIPEGATLYVSV